MNKESSFNTKGMDQELTQVQLEMPMILEQLSHEFGILIGKEGKVPSSSEIKSITQKMVRLAKVAKEIEALKQQEITPSVAARLLLLFNKLLCLSYPQKIPKGIEPIDYSFSILHSMAIEPVWEQEPLLQGINCSEKWQNYREFVGEVMQIADATKLDDFLQEAASGRNLVSQFQKGLNKILLPKGLERLPKNNTVKAVEELKDGLRSVLADWEGLVNLAYGLKRLKENREEPWSKISSKPLRKKVEELMSEALLCPLVTIEWVIVRNSLAHGTAFFEPRCKEIYFKDRDQQISWGLQKVRIEGINIYLSNFAIMATWVFINAERGKKSEQMIADLRELASMKTQKYLA